LIETLLTMSDKMTKAGAVRKAQKEKTEAHDIDIAWYMNVTFASGGGTRVKLMLFKNLKTVIDICVGLRQRSLMHHVSVKIMRMNASECMLPITPEGTPNEIADEIADWIRLDDVTEDKLKKFDAAIKLSTKKNKTKKDDNKVARLLSESFAF
jgi:hypothetical protein